MAETTPEYARDVWRNLLRPALERLCWEGERQLAWLDELRISEDELALDFDHAFGCRWILKEHGWISAEADGLLGQINALFDEMSAQPGERWTDAAILHGPEWASLRELATQALRALSGLPT